MYSATVMRITDEQGDRCVCIHADPVIWVSPDLLALARDPAAPYVPGAMKADGDRIEFGVDGEGIGRVAYRLLGRATDRHGAHWHVAERISDRPTTTEEPAARPSTDPTT